MLRAPRLERLMELVKQSQSLVMKSRRIGYSPRGVADSCVVPDVVRCPYGEAVSAPAEM